MQTSGLILDVYDDVGGTQLKSFFHTREEIPDFVKSAAALSDVDRSKLPDDAFALVLLNDGEKFRKYACIDEGNTALSVIYFIKNAHKLPDTARARCAENLKIASGWYGLDVPEELEKEAGLSDMVVNHVAKNPVGSLMTAATLPGTIRNTKGAVDDNMRRVREGEAMGGVQGGLASQGSERLASANLEYLKLSAAFKAAETSGTNLMPLSNDDKDGKDEDPAATIKKTSSTGHLLPGHRGHQSIEPDVASSVPGKNPASAPQHMNPVVEVTGKEPRKEQTEKKASSFALPSYGRYPLDSYGQVKQASAFFEEYGRRLSPVDRREFCVNLTKQAEAMHIPVSDTVKKYGSEKYASAQELEVALGTRRQLLQSDDITLLDKIASVMPSMQPDDFASVLEAFDQSRGLHHHYDSHVMDPYYSTFGFEKKAEDAETWSDVVGNYNITAHELKTFALSGWMRLKKQFGHELADEFRKDPVGIYKSLPTEQKILIIRLATENSPV